MNPIEPTYIPPTNILRAFLSITFQGLAARHAAELALSFSRLAARHALLFLPHRHSEGLTIGSP